MVALLAGKGLALGDRQAAGRRQSSRRPCAEPASGRSGPWLSIPAAPRVGRPLPIARGARSWRVSPAGDHDRRCGWRGVRQSGKAARPALSRRPGDRGACRGRRFGCSAVAAAAGRLGRASFLFRGAQKRRSARGRFRSVRTRRYRRFLPAGRRRLPGRSHPARASSAAMHRRSSLPAGSPPTAPSGLRSSNSPAIRAASSASRRAWLCTDNAAMIAWAGAERFGQGLTDTLDAPARARWPLDPNADKVRGAGVKA